MFECIRHDIYLYILYTYTLCPACTYLFNTAEAASNVHYILHAGYHNINQPMWQTVLSLRAFFLLFLAYSEVPVLHSVGEKEKNTK